MGRSGVGSYIALLIMYMYSAVLFYLTNKCVKYITIYLFQVLVGDGIDRSAYADL